MERKTYEPMLIDGMAADLGDPQTINPLEQLNRVIPWEKLAQPIRQTYQNDTAKGGRPNVPVVMPPGTQTPRSLKSQGASGK